MWTIHRSSTSAGPFSTKQDLNKKNGLNPTSINVAYYRELTAMYDPNRGKYECGREDTRKEEITEEEAKVCYIL